MRALGIHSQQWLWLNTEVFEANGLPALCSRQDFVAARPALREVGIIPLDGYSFARPGHTGLVWLGIRPEHLLTGDAAASAPVRFDLRADLVEPMGAGTLVWSSLAGVPLKLRLDGQTRVAAGDVLPVGLDPARASIFDQADELRV